MYLYFLFRNDPFAQTEYIKRTVFTYLTRWKPFFPKNDILMQPKDATVTKPKRTLPPKQEVKTESFQGIQLKPVSKDSKQPQQAENGRVELKVAPLKGINAKILLQYLYVALSLYVFLNFSKSRFTAPNSAQLKQDRSIFVFLYIYTSNIFS